MAEAATGLQFVLVHGSWHTGAGWRHVSGHLTAAGHRVLAPILAGRGEGAATGISMMDMVDGLCAEVEGADLTDIVLVGHSAGGTVVAKAAERLAA